MGRALELVQPAKGGAEAEARREYRDALRRLERRGRETDWWQWWFADAPWSRRVMGGALVALLALYLLLPLVSFETKNLIWWVSFGKDWQGYIVPVATILLLLFSPVISRVGPQGVELAPRSRPPEVEMRELTVAMQPRLE